jgi:hypothetical protein
VTAWWRTLRRAADPRRAAGDAQRLDAIAHTLDGLRAEMTATARDLATATGELRAVQRQMERLLALRVDEAHVAERLDRLEPVLDPGRAGAHVRAAIARASLVASPVPHLEVPDVLPADVYAALADAVPPDIFFEIGADGRRELPLPLALAPVHSIAAWTFMAQLARTEIGPAVAARFADLPGTGLAAAGPIRTSRGRLVYRHAGDAVPAEHRRASQAVTLVLTMTGIGEPPLPIVLRPHGEPGIGTVELPLTAGANRLLAFASLSGQVEWASGSVADGATTPGVITYESRITATQAG